MKYPGNLIRKIEEYSRSPYGRWLDEFDWRKVKIKPMKINIEGVITAMYCVLTNTVKIAPDKDEAVFFGSVIHELYHAGQRSELGWLGYLAAKTFFRDELEYPAKKYELSAVEWFCENRRIKYE